MKARLIKVLCCGLLLLSVTSLSAFSLAQVFDADWWVGGTLVVPTNGNVQASDNVEQDGQGPDMFKLNDVKASGLGYGIFITHQWYNSMAILPSYRLEAQAWRFAPGYTLNGDYEQSVPDDEPSSVPLSQSMSLSVNDISLSMLFDLFNYGSLTPYVGVGAALLHSHVEGYTIGYSNSEGVTGPWVSIAEGSATSVSMQYELGLDYHVSSLWAATLSYEYYPKVAIKSGDIDDNSLLTPINEKPQQLKTDMSLGFLNIRLAYRF